VNQQQQRKPQQTQRSVLLPTENPSSFVGLSGGQIFHELMLRHNVRKVFGYPGGAILPVFDAIHESKYFDFILPRHEQGAGHMAEGYARATGEPGVVLVTSGPGATNVITPIQDALSDGVPLVVFSGQVPTAAIGTDAFQEADVIGISRACTKWNTMVKDINELPQRINEAFAIATSGRPGPVLVDLPKDVTASILTRVPNLEPNIPALKIKESQQQGCADSSHQNLQRVAELIQKAQRPIIYAGNGVINAHNGNKLLRQLAETANIPVTTTLQAMGAFDEMHPLSLHMLGMHGSAYANLAIQNADLVISLGARFDDRVTGNLFKFAPEARKAEMEGRGGIVHFDICPKNINKVVDVTVSVEGDLGQQLQSLMPMIRYKENRPWIDQCQEWKEKYPFRYDNAFSDHESTSSSSLLKPQEVLEELNKQLAEQMQRNNVTITTGVGQHQMWAAQFLRWRHPRSFISSGGLGTMGFGLPAAIGAQLGRPNHIVVDIDGDASFSMTGMELMTASEFNIPVKVLILNNSFQGMVRQWQDLFYEQRYSGTKMTNPDFVKLAESMGCRGLRVSDRKDLPEVIRSFLFDDELDGGHTRPVLLDCVVEAAEHVYPMVPAGKGLHEMVLGVNEVMKN
jgi:acetolactate synthase I/II/III large subunit